MNSIILAAGHHYPFWYSMIAIVELLMAVSVFAIILRERLTEGIPGNDVTLNGFLMCAPHAIGVQRPPPHL